ncbi:hypothetical protein QTO34_017796 [Cnephaeus nilssonii]|uniref:Protein kinase domain-containing protein n=1 Tax=Cnephaeus nilssonii TaxID=3371016 RepID=A0AA40I2K0_CNENI|nr:hypothetical protein QTO34_017796 [Eptesicus nilssonii]
MLDHAVVQAQPSQGSKLVRGRMNGSALEEFSVCSILLFSETILVNYSQPCSVHSLWIKHRVDSCVAMGEEKGMTQMLKECSLSDKLCIVWHQQYEIIIIPAFLVGASLIILGVILWLFIREKRAQQQSPGIQDSYIKSPILQLGSNTHLICNMSKAKALLLCLHLGAKTGKQEDMKGSVFVPLKETSVESLLQTSTHALAELQIPREQLSEVLEWIYNGSCGAIYRTKMYPGDPAKSKDVVLKVLKEPARLQEIQDFLGRIQFYQYLGSTKTWYSWKAAAQKESRSIWCWRMLPRGTCSAFSGPVAGSPPLAFLITPNFSLLCIDVMTMDGLLYDLTEKQVYHIGKQVLLALLCGLGLAYEVHTQGAITLTSTVPLKWLAPERLLLRPAGIRGDIWSFGILLYEMVTLGAPPYPEVPPISILQHLQRGKIMKRPSSCTQNHVNLRICLKFAAPSSCRSVIWYSLMKSCWRWKEDKRPSLRELCSRLETAARTADDKAVLQVPELVVPELYAAVAGISVKSLSYSYSVL